MTKVQDIIHTITLFVKEHEIWAVPIVFLLAFGESLAFISLLITCHCIIPIEPRALIGESGLLFGNLACRRPRRFFW